MIGLNLNVQCDENSEIGRFFVRYFVILYVNLDYSLRFIEFELLYI